MNKLCLYFFDEEALIDFPKNLQTLKKLISIYFMLSEESISEINLCYNNSDSSVINIKNEEDFNSFLKKNISNLYLDVGQNSDIYEEYLEGKEGNSDKKYIKRLNELLSKDEEYTKNAKTKFKKEEDEIIEINKLIEELRLRKIELVKYINKNKEAYEIEHKQVRDELTQLQIKLGIQPKYEQTKK